MSIEENKALIRKFITEVVNVGNLDAISDYFVPGSMLAGGIEGQNRAMKTAFPDMQMTIDELIAEGDKVVARVTSQGTHTGPLLGLPAFGRLETPVPPTGNAINVTGMMIYTVRDGKIISGATELDQIGLLRQLGWTFSPPAA